MPRIQLVQDINRNPISLQARGKPDPGYPAINATQGIPAPLKIQALKNKEAMP
ncbi:hypothetical protein [Microcoleus sp. FACHB-68]|uniref:hypothetical protein n=1 Tax=Microcoleus sp. FACHB-68 TaxID=2692826 RepID=UPI00168701E1|nr:hypothetical protein [Microcoleus sp. FACHB-68]MBD1940636.1 hypothetical protein [Microcoleus sp. FACHB-68]